MSNRVGGHTMSDRMVKGYLRELEENLSDLPAARRRELVAEIAEHIDAALADVGTASEADVRNVLDRLGDPSTIAAEARERFGVRAVKPGFREWLAIVLLPVGGLVFPVIGWIVGVILLWTSPVWTTREKWIGTLVLPGGLLFPLALPFVSTSACIQVSEPGSVVQGTCSGPSLLNQAVLIAAWAVLILAPILVAVFLARRMNARRAAA